MALYECCIVMYCIVLTLLPETIFICDLSFFYLDDQGKDTTSILSVKYLCYDKNMQMLYKVLYKR